MRGKKQSGLLFSETLGRMQIANTLTWDRCQRQNHRRERTLSIRFSPLSAPLPLKCFLECPLSSAPAHPIFCPLRSGFRSAHMLWSLHGIGRKNKQMRWARTMVVGRRPSCHQSSDGTAWNRCLFRSVLLHGGFLSTPAVRLQRGFFDSVRILQLRWI